MISDYPASTASPLCSLSLALEKLRRFPATPLVPLDCRIPLPAIGCSRKSASTERAIQGDRYSEVFQRRQRLWFHPPENGGQGVFVHVSALERGGSLREGDKVSLELGQDRKTGNRKPRTFRFSDDGIGFAMNPPRARFSLGTASGRCAAGSMSMLVSSLSIARWARPRTGPRSYPRGDRVSEEIYSVKATGVHQRCDDQT